MGIVFELIHIKDCSFGCEYCFINNRHENNPRMGDRLEKIKPANIEQIKKMFKKAIDDNDVNIIEREMLNKYVPLHLGGNSDPFNLAEKKYKVTYEFLKLSKKYNYPVMISTKTSYIPNEYFEFLDPNLHAFQISLISNDSKFNRIFEKYTNTKGRINLIKKLKERGFWVGLRIQPLINVDKSIELIKMVEEHIDYITVEHIKLQNDNKEKMNFMLNKLPFKKDEYIYMGNSCGLRTDIKLNNINLIKSSTNIKVGCGDNDLHEFSDSYNCCGVDTITSDSFKNWLKYNSMTISMKMPEISKNGFKSNIHCFPYIKKDFLNTYDEYVDYFVKNIYKPFKQEKSINDLF